jgi:hypothetical protein
MTRQGGLPGQRDSISTSPRNIIASYTPPPGYIVGGVVIDATFSYDGSQASGDEQKLRAGIPMAKITGSGLWAPCKRTRVNMTGATATEIVLDDARFFQVGDTVQIGSDTDLEITAIDYATNTITIASTTVADNDDVFVDHADQAGLEICRGFLNEYVNLVDEDHVARDKQASKVVNRGLLANAMILGDLDAIRNETGHYIDGILWDDLHGNAATA